MVLALADIQAVDEFGRLLTGRGSLIFTGLPLSVEGESLFPWPATCAVRKAVTLLGIELPDEYRDSGVDGAVFARGPADTEAPWKRFP